MVTATGTSGNDILTGGAGDDTLEGGDGNDIYVVNSAGDLIIEQFGGGVDLVRAYISYTLAANLENMTLMGTSSIDGAGNNLNNSLKGNSGDNWLRGLDGNDQLDGGAGADTLLGGTGSDYLRGGTGADIFGFLASDLSTGSATDQIADLNFGEGDRIILGGYREGPERILSSYADLVRLMDRDPTVKVVNRNESGQVNISIAGPGGAVQTITILDATAWSQFSAAAVRPVATHDTATTSERTSITVNALSNDTGPGLILVGATTPTGQASVVGNQVAFNPGNAFGYLHAGETATVEIAYTVETAAGRSASSTITMTITGVDNAAEISGTDRGQVQEGAAERAEGVLHAEDADHGQSSFRAESVRGEYGTLTIAADGAWAYELDEEAEGLRTLNSGESAAEHITVRSEDGTTHSVEITVHGSDERIVRPTAHSGADPNDNDGVTGGGVLYSTVSPGGLNGANILYGTNGADSIDARNGNDTVYGWGGDDFIIGGQGVDTIYGGSGNDEIQGNQATDNLYGGSGDDFISGIAGDDLIVGGYGADRLTGNQGADIFRFLDARDTNDTITDFLPGSDKIDLSNFTAGGVQHDFAAPVNASTFAAGRDLIWFSEGGNTVILGNTDGDFSTAEFMITIVGNPAITTADFIL